MKKLSQKQTAELAYWQWVKRERDITINSHYQQLYTECFGLDAEWYRGKVLLDIGCGPRGSLEWATMAARRIGLDPLMDEYRELRGGGGYKYGKHNRPC